MYRLPLLFILPDKTLTSIDEGYRGLDYATQKSAPVAVHLVNRVKILRMNYFTI